MDPSPEHLLALDNLKAGLGGLYDAERHPDRLLLRFLRARGFDQTATLKMWTDYIKWRQDAQVDSIRDSLEFPEFLVVKKYYPRLYFNTDKLGRPVYIERLGQVDIAKLLQVTTNERMLQYTIYMYEKLTNYILPGCSIAAGKNIEQTLTILDLSGIYLSSFPSVFTLLSDISNVAQNYYPETLGKMFIINAPMLFYGVWALISPLLNEVTVKKISILGSSYKTELLEYIENENLPDFLGGTCTSNNWENVDVGPWKNTDLANEKWERLNRAYGI